MVMWDKSGKVIKIPFAVKVGMECMYLKPIKLRPFGLGMSYLPKITIINIQIGRASCRERVLVAV